MNIGRSLDKSREANPWATGLGEVAGGLVTGAAGAGKALAMQGLKGMFAAGAASGAVAGAGYSDADSAGGVATDAAVGAGMGGMLGTAVGGASSGVRNVAQRFSRKRMVSQMMDDLIERTGMSHDTVNQMLRDAPDMVLADVDDHARAMLQEFGGAKQFAKLEARTRGARERVLADLSKSFNKPVTGPVYKALKDEAMRISDVADMHYQAAYATKLSGGARQRIAELLQGPTHEKATKHAMKLWDAENPGVAPPDTFDVQWLDYLQRGFWDMASKAKPQLKKALKSRRRQLLELVDAESEDFKRARALWRGKSADVEAADLGKKILSPKVLNDREAIDKIAEFLPSEEAFFKMGVVEAFDDKLSRASNLSDVTKFIRENDGVSKVLKTSMGPERFKVFMKRMDMESAKYRTYEALKPRGLRVDQGDAIPSYGQDMRNIGLSLLADAGLNTSGGIATHAAYRQAMRNSLKRFGMSLNVDEMLTGRLMSNKPVVPGKPPSPFAFKRTAGAAGTLPPWALSQE